MEDIVALRKKIAKKDDKILQLLNERMNISKKIGAIKRNYKIPIRDPQREDEVYKHVNQKAYELGLDASKIMAIYRGIIAMCTDAQKCNSVPHA